MHGVCAFDLKLSDCRCRLPLPLVKELFYKIRDLNFALFYKQLNIELLQMMIQMLPHQDSPFLRGERTKKRVRGVAQS